MFENSSHRPGDEVIDVELPDHQVGLVGVRMEGALGEEGRERGGGRRGREREREGKEGGREGGREREGERGEGRR